jgi:hypothetical protein
MSASKFNLIWANKPGCSRSVAEVWVGRDYLWMILFIDDADGVIRVELLPSLPGGSTHLLGLADAERVIAEAKRDLLAMGGR